MAKGNLFLGFGRGSVGDVTFTHANGEQIARARNRAPRNPRSALQLLQRVCLKTSSSAYSLLQELTNHSFQGFAEGTQSQSEFNRLNIQKFREKLASYINSGDEQEILECEETNFASKGSSLVEINPYIVSSGSLAALPIAFMGSAASPAFAIAVALPSATPSYADVVAALKLVRGDQLTFLSLSCDDTIDGGVFNGFEYCRVILDPSDTDMTQPFLDGTSINLPNEKNRGDFSFSVQQVSGVYYLCFVASSMTMTINRANTMAAGTCIVSRSNGSVWQRSPQSLVVRPSLITQPGHLEWDHETDYLADAIYSYMSDESSLLYLNQAGAGASNVGPAVPAQLLTVLVNQYPKTRDEVSPPVVSPFSVTATMAGGSATKTYKLAVYQVSGGQPTTKISDATFTDGSAQIASQAYSGKVAIVLLENDAIVDNFVQFDVTTS